MSVLTIVNFGRELNIPVYLENGCTFSIIPRQYYYRHDTLHKLQECQLTIWSCIQVHIWIVSPLYIQHVAIQLQSLMCDTKARWGILFWKDTYDQLGCWQDYTNMIVYGKQLTILLVLGKGFTIVGNMTTQITLQPKYTTTPFQTKLDFQGQTMISVDPNDKCSASYGFILHSETNGYIISLKNIKSNMICFSPGQTVVYLDWRSICCSLSWYIICDNTPYMQNYTLMPEGMLHDMLSPESFQNVTQKEKYHFLYYYQPILMSVIQTRQQKMIITHG